MVAEGVVGISGHVDDLRARPKLDDVPRELGAAHLRHDHVGEQEVDRLGRVAAQAERLVAARGLQHCVPRHLEDLARQLADVALVLDEQDRLRAARFAASLGR